MSLYIRCKRTNQTIFLYVESTDTVTEVKKKISSIIKTPADNIRLLNVEHQVLADDKILSDLKIDNDSIVHWVQKKEGSDAWEEVNIQKIEAAKQDDKPEDKST